MAPNPIMLQRAQAAQSKNSRHTHPRHAPSLSAVIMAASASAVLLASVSWSRRWFLSGAAIETFVIILGHGNDHRIFASIPLWTVLATLNLVYAVCSTSWLLYGIFAAACYPWILITCLFQFAQAADLARRALRKTLGELHFTRDKIAFFNLPALEIDVDVYGLLVLRGVTISLSTLTIVVHGIELGECLRHLSGCD